MRILNIRVDEKNTEQVMAAIENFIAAFRSGAAKCQQIITINPEGIMLAQEDPALATIINEAALVTADGNGILWAAKQKGQPLAERVTGIDLTYKLCSQAAEQSYSIYLLGGKEGVAAAAAARLIEQYPSLVIKGVDNGYFADREETVIADIAAKKPDILFAALGMPYQEKWLHNNANKLDCGVMIGVGGSFDVIAGNVRRAPVFMQKLRLEWLWRLLISPSRWRRYAAIPRFMAAVKKELKTSRN